MRDAVVVGVDGSRWSIRALEWAAGEAELHRKPLMVVHVLPRHQYDIPVFPPGRWEAAVAIGEQIVAEAAEIARDCCPGLEVAQDMPSAGLAGPVTELRREASDAHEAVVGARGRGGFRTLVLGSTSLQLAGHADSPVVVVRDAPNITHRRIVVGVDGSPHSEAALDYAFAQAATRGATLHAAHIWQPPPWHGQRSERKALTPEEQTELEHQVLVDMLTERSGGHPDVEVDRDLVEGHPAQVLVQLSAEADMVVVGSRGHGGFHGLSLGSVSHAVLHHALCPVAIVRPRR